MLWDLDKTKSRYPYLAHGRSSHSHQPTTSCRSWRGTYPWYVKCWLILPDEVDGPKLVTLLGWHCCWPDFLIDSRHIEQYRRVSTTTCQSSHCRDQKWCANRPPILGAMEQQQQTGPMTNTDSCKVQIITLGKSHSASRIIFRQAKFFAAAAASREKNSAAAAIAAA